MNAINTQFSRAIRTGFRKGSTGMADHARMDHALSNDELMAFAPSIFGTTAHESRSARFTAVPTINVVEGLRGAGFMPYAAKQAKTRDEGRVDFTKHLVRFRQEGAGNGTFRNDDAIAEIILVNANDGTSSYQLYGGLFRTLCLNGLFVSDSTIQSVRVGHTGNIVNRVIEGSFNVLEQTTKALEVRDQWKAITLAPREQQLLAQSAHMMRFGERAEGEAPNPIRAEQLLTVRRTADEGADLWSTFNRVQENALRGGLVGHTKAGYVQTPEGQVWKPSRRIETREVKGIDQDVKLNKALWALADGMATLKAAA